MKAYFNNFMCEADCYRSLNNKQDLRLLITRYGKYSKEEIKHLSTIQLRQMWHKVFYDYEKERKKQAEEYNGIQNEVLNVFAKELL